MMRSRAILSLLLVSAVGAGCRTCSLLNPYANAVDDIKDSQVYFDNWYRPRLDISRAGKPDWCGSINSKIGGNICYLGCYDKYDDCHLYPPSNPYSFPSSTMPDPTVWTPPAVTEPAPLEMPPTPSPAPMPPEG